MNERTNKLINAVLLNCLFIKESWGGESITVSTKKLSSKLFSTLIFFNNNYYLFI